MGLLDDLAGVGGAFDTPALNARGVALAGSPDALLVPLGPTLQLPLPVPTPFNELFDDIFTRDLGGCMAGDDSGEMYAIGAYMPLDGCCCCCSLLDTGVLAPLLDGIENTDRPFAAAAGDSMFPTIAKDAAEVGVVVVAEKGKIVGLYGVVGDIRGNVRGGSVMEKSDVSGSLGVGTRSRSDEDLND